MGLQCLLLQTVRPQHLDLGSLLLYDKDKYIQVGFSEDNNLDMILTSIFPASVFCPPG